MHSAIITCSGSMKRATVMSSRLQMHRKSEQQPQERRGEVTGSVEKLYLDAGKDQRIVTTHAVPFV